VTPADADDSPTREAAAGSAARAAYVRAVAGPREPLLDEVLRRSLLEERMPTIQIDDNAGRILQLLTALRKPSQVVELGTLFGYSTIYLARGLREDARLTTVEIDPGRAELARRNLERAGVSHRVEVVVGDALEYLSSLESESVGMIFLDADKRSYVRYLRECARALEPGGLLVADDAFADGDYGREHGGETEQAEERRAILEYGRAVTRARGLLSAFVATDTGLLVSLKLEHDG